MTLSERDSGGKITSIQSQQKRRRGRVNVYLDDHFAFSLSELVAERARLRPGLLLSPLDVARLTADDCRQVALDSALGYLSYRQRSERELRQNLTRKGVPLDLQEHVMLRLRDLGLVDDQSFAKFWIENRDRFSPRGSRALRSELFGKGVARDIVDQAIAEGDDEEHRALAVAEKKAARMHGLDYRTFHQRLMALLVRRGFSYDVSSHAARELWRREEAGES